MKLIIAISLCLLLGIAAGLLTSCAPQQTVDVEPIKAEVARLKKANEQLKKDLNELEQSRNRLQIDLEHAVNRCPVKPQRSNFIFIKQKVGVA